MEISVKTILVFILILGILIYLRKCVGFKGVGGMSSGVGAVYERPTPLSPKPKSSV